jgi:hypothetical protein
MRKTLTITVTAEGRDQGKAFLLTEMPAAQAEEWGARALLALMRSGVEVPENIASIGLAGVAVLGIRALSGLEWSLAKPLFDEMWTCVQIIPNPAKPEVVRNLVDSDIEEVKTRLFLRKEIIGLHVDFFTDAAPSTQASGAASGPAA